MALRGLLVSGALKGLLGETLPPRPEVRYIYRAMPTPLESHGIMFFIGQGGYLMYVIIALSVVALTIVLAKFWGLARYRAELQRLTERLQRFAYDLPKEQLGKNEQVEAAIGFCREHESALGRLFEAALLYRSEPRTEITRRLERHGAETVVSLETYMTALASVVGVAPMIGFLGTIIGLVEAFMSWETLGDQITVGVLAGGIYKAMLTTAAGLSVAIPYYLLYNHLTTRVQGLARLTETRTEEFLDALTESSS